MTPDERDAAQQVVGGITALYEEPSLNAARAVLDGPSLGHGALRACSIAMQTLSTATRRSPITVSRDVDAVLEVMANQDSPLGFGTQAYADAKQLCAVIAYGQETGKDVPFTQVLVDMRRLAMAAVAVLWALINALAMSAGATATDAGRMLALQIARMPAS